MCPGNGTIQCALENGLTNVGIGLSNVQWENETSQCSLGMELANGMGLFDVP